ncbi:MULTISPECIES: phytanoyl-CoA dioxygenase family protein [Sulfurimonas]|uniref:Phytanoyl-CoA dioxygenase family protein n=1 Tax=Sulfurimonas diazotrophicus TaxID=3131939 RepID=A0ABZ3HAC1_9BACT
MKLSDAQLAQFERDGYILLRGFADKARCEAILAAAKEEIEARTPPIETEGEYTGSNNSTLRRLRQVYDRREIFREWMTDKEIRPMLAQVLHDTPVLTLAHHNSIMTKMPSKSTESRWHQDRRYWHFENDNLVSVWLALGDERMENGVLEFIDGSHKLEYRPEQFDTDTSFLTGLPENDALIAKKVHYDLHAGDVILFHCRTLHHAYDNQTDEPKIAFVYTVKGASTKPVPGTRSAEYPEVVLEV